MEADEQKLEKLLGGMAPAKLDERLLERLEMAMDGRLQGADVSLAGIQAKLRELEPAVPREDLCERLAGVVEGVPFPVDEKVVMFPRGGQSRGAVRKPRRPWVSAAAVVGLLGALTAFLVTPTGEPSPVASERRAPARPAAPEEGAFVPAAFGSDVSDTRDLGVRWLGGTRPMRVMRVEYQDKVSFFNDKGERVELEVPRVELVVMPEKID